MSKWIVKKAAERWLPKEIIFRKKFGFDVPVGQWLKNKRALGAHLDVLQDAKFRSRGYFDDKAVRMLIDEHLRGDADHTEILWGLLGFEIWCRLFIDSSLEELAVSSTSV